MEVKGEKYLFNSIEVLKNNPGLVREAVENAPDAQKTVLADILSYAANTEFGKRYDFSSISESMRW